MRASSLSSTARKPTASPSSTATSSSIAASALDVAADPLALDAVGELVGHERVEVEAREAKAPAGDVDERRRRAQVAPARRASRRRARRDSAARRCANVRFDVDDGETHAPSCRRDRSLCRRRRAFAYVSDATVVVRDIRRRCRSHRPESRTRRTARRLSAETPATSPPSRSRRRASARGTTRRTSRSRPRAGWSARSRAARAPCRR